MEVVVKGIYRHFKGDYVIVEDVALDSETLEKVVVYRELHGKCQLWVRPYNMFVEKISGQKQKHRFELQNVKSVRE